MIKKIASLAMIIGFLGAVGALETWTSNYQIDGRVISSTDSTATLADFRGYEWNVYTNRKVMEGTEITIYFHDNLTPDNINDDIVKDISIKREGI